MRERDPQQYIELFWEAEYVEPLFSRRQLKIIECEKIARKICRRHGIKAPVIGKGKSKEYPCSLDITFTKRGKDEVSHLIQLPKGSRDIVTVIHESCHFLKHHYDPDCSHHGPVFVRLMIDECARANRMLNIRWLEEGALRHGLRVCRQSLFNYKNRTMTPIPACTECLRLRM